MGWVMVEIMEWTRAPREFSVKEDRIEIRDCIFKAPEWKMLDNGKLTYDEAKKEATFVRLPERQELPQDIDEALNGLKFKAKALRKKFGRKPYFVLVPISEGVE